MPCTIVISVALLVASQTLPQPAARHNCRPETASVLRATPIRLDDRQSNAARDRRRLERPVAELGDAAAGAARPDSR